MMAPTLVFPRAHYDDMLAYVLADPTTERCGLLAGTEGIVDKVLPVPNALNSPVAYLMDGPEFAAAMVACAFEPLGIFHSHPVGPPVPSPTDIAQAAYPDSLYVVISLQSTLPSVRVFRIVDEQVSELNVDILST